MSKYVNYNVHARNRRFDEIRKPVAAKHIIRALHTELRKPIGEAHVLDAGCGTGSYSKDLCSAGVSRITLLDANDMMLQTCREKLNEFSESCHLDFIQHQLPSKLPFEDHTFDCIMFNNVLHHLDVIDYDHLISTNQRVEVRPKHIEALKEAKRVLKPDGIVAITMSFPHQVLRGSWYFNLAPLAQKRAALRGSTYDEHVSFLKQAGFENVEFIVPLDTTYLTPDHYFDLEGPLRKEWREIDSILFTCPDSVDLDKVTRMKEEGTLEQYFQEHDQGRKEVGQLAVAIAKA